MSEVKVPYWHKLQDPRWQKLRLEIFQRDSFSCRHCGETKKTLNVHHIYYVSGREPWEYPNGAFQTLCSGCHKRIKEISSMVQFAWEGLVGIDNESDLMGSDLNMAQNLSSFQRRTGMEKGQAWEIICRALEFCDRSAFDRLDKEGKVASDEFGKEKFQNAVGIGGDQ